MSWTIPAIAAYFLFALSSIADRFLLAGPLPNPRVYAFTASITGVFVIPIIFFLSDPIPPLAPLLLALITGLISIGALVALYSAVWRAGVSRVVPLTGALTPLVTLLFSAIASPAARSVRVLDDMALLILGTILLSMRSDTKGSLLSGRTIRDAVLASLFFALSIVLAKRLYAEIGFLSGIVWSSIGSLLASGVILLSKETRRTVLAAATWRPTRVWAPVLAAKTAGGAGVLLFQYAILLAPYGKLAVLNALQGVQYFFLFLLVAVVSAKNPELLREEFTRRAIIVRFLGILAVATGLLATIR